jgi:VCBS repeat-containing protein
MLSIGSATGVTGDLDGSDGTMTLSGSLSAVNAALANLTYKPNTNITGADTLSIQTKDASATVNGSLAIAINDQQPILSGQQTELNENAANGSQVLAFPVAGDRSGLTFSIVSGNDAGAFSIDPTTGVITVADTTKLDFETSTTFQLVIGVDDEDAGTAPNSQEGLVISVKDINERPTDLSMDRTTIAQSAASTAAAIGTLSSTDPDANDSFAYALVTGAGDTNNDLFQVNGSVLKAQAALAAGTYTIRVRTMDAGNLTLEKQLTITVTDDVGPIIQGVSAADTAFKIGDVMTVTIQAGEAGLLLESGTVNGKALANFTDKGDGSYTAIYTIAEGDPERAAGDSIPVQLSLKDQAGNISASFTSAIVNAHDAIDSVRPTAGVPALSSASDTGLSASDGVTSATQQEFRGTGEDGVRVELVEGQTVLATTTIAGGTWTAFLSLAEGQHNLNAVYTDPAGNAALSSPVTVIVDRTAPAAVDDTGTADLRTASTTTANALSNDSDALRVVAVSGAAANIGAPVSGSNGGVFTFAADGTVSFDPGQSFAALASGQTRQTDVALMVSDLAGNESSSTYTVTVTGKNDAPILQTKVPLSLTASTTSIITASLLKATDADDAASELHYTLTSGPAEGMLKLAGVDVQVGSTFTQADIDNGRLQYVAGTTAGAQSFVFSVADGGEDGAAAISAQTFDITVNPAVITPPPPVVPPVVIGEVEVTTSTGSDANGRPTTTTTITPSPTGSGEATSGIPLLGSQSEPVVTGTLPANVQLVATGLSNPVPVSDIQTILTQSLPSGMNVDASSLLSGINQVTGAGAVSNVVVSTLTPTLVSGTTGTSGPISIDGANAASQGAALIIDARGLPPGTVLQLNNVGIAIVSGPVVVTGGSGSNVVIGDSAGQTIILGPSDDVLRGGDGDDIIGSKDGNDLLYGDGGNDTVFGGTGNDRLDGGAGNDILRGDEGTDIARFHVNVADAKITRNADGSLTVQHLKGDGGTDTVSTVELLQFNDTVMVTHAIKPATHFDLSDATKEKEYLAHNPDVAKAVAAGQIASGAEHWQKWGKAEGRSYDKPAVDAALFDEAFYLQQNPDVAAAVASGKIASALEHYLAFGLKEGRDASALFDASWYLSKNADVAAAVTAGVVGSALEHYALFGWKEGRAASAYFDGARYLTDNPDVAAAGMDPLVHYQMYGQAEGRSLAVTDQGLWLV